ncbi:MAG TPA: DUF4093 domain-containing protein [Candidatus Faecivivens stercorigallinarum]|nr:DUF4093 domain-containing protein [Candidatus Faecivivens stercorigallinarum]
MRLQELIDGTIIETGGFGIFTDPEKLELLRQLAEKEGLIILTDSDRAGFRIRHYIRSAMPDVSRLINVYIPDIFGKERRKNAPSKEGKLGVEGIPVGLLKKAFEKAGVMGDSKPAKADDELITKADLYLLGLSGTDDAAVRRAALLKKLSLPSRLTAKGLLPVLNTLYTREEFYQLMERFDQTCDQ